MKSKSTILLIVAILIGWRLMIKDKTEVVADLNVCYCFEYYNKHAAHKDRVVEQTCDDAIFSLSDKLEIFKVVVDCDSIDYLKKAHSK